MGPTEYDSEIKIGVTSRAPSYVLHNSTTTHRIDKMKTVSNLERFPFLGGDREGLGHPRYINLGRRKYLG